MEIFNIIVKYEIQTSVDCMKKPIYLTDIILKIRIASEVVPDEK